MKHPQYEKKILEFNDNFNLRIYIIEIHYVIPTLLKRMVTFRKEVGCITENYYKP